MVLKAAETIISVEPLVQGKKVLQGVLISEYPIYGFHLYSLNCSGDHIRVHRKVYYHHMMVTKVIDKSHLRVIHYTGGDESGKEVVKAVSSHNCKAEIVETIREIKKSEEIELLRYKNGEDIYTPREAISRARSRLGEKDYNLVTNNCECFINWAYTDRDVSGQVEKVKVGVTVGGAVLGGLALGAAAAIGYGLWKAFGDDGKEKKEQEDFEDDDEEERPYNPEKVYRHHKQL